MNNHVDLKELIDIASIELLNAMENHSMQIISHSPIADLESRIEILLSATSKVLSEKVVSASYIHNLESFATWIDSKLEGLAKDLHDDDSYKAYRLCCLVQLAVYTILLSSVGLFLIPEGLYNINKGGIKTVVVQSDELDYFGVVPVSLKEPSSLFVSFYTKVGRYWNSIKAREWRDLSKSLAEANKLTDQAKKILLDVRIEKTLELDGFQLSEYLNKLSASDLNAIFAEKKGLVNSEFTKISSELNKALKPEILKVQKSLMSTSVSNINKAACINKIIYINELHLTLKHMGEYKNDLESQVYNEIAKSRAKQAVTKFLLEKQHILASIDDLVGAIDQILFAEGEMFRDVDPEEDTIFRVCELGSDTEITNHLHSMRADLDLIRHKVSESLDEESLKQAFNSALLMKYALNVPKYLEILVGGSSITSLAIVSLIAAVLVDGCVMIMTGFNADPNLRDFVGIHYSDYVNSIRDRYDPVSKREKEIAELLVSYRHDVYKKSRADQHEDEFQYNNDLDGYSTDSSSSDHTDSELASTVSDDSEIMSATDNAIEDINKSMFGGIKWIKPNANEVWKRRQVYYKKGVQDLRQVIYDRYKKQLSLIRSAHSTVGKSINDMFDVSTAIEKEAKDLSIKYWKENKEEIYNQIVKDLGGKNDPKEKSFIEYLWGNVQEPIVAINDILRKTSEKGPKSFHNVSRKSIEDEAQRRMNYQYRLNVIEKKSERLSKKLDYSVLTKNLFAILTDQAGKQQTYIERAGRLCLDGTQHLEMDATTPQKLAKINVFDFLDHIKQQENLEFDNNPQVNELKKQIFDMIYEVFQDETNIKAIGRYKKVNNLISISNSLNVFMSDLEPDLSELVQKLQITSREFKRQYDLLDVTDEKAFCDLEDALSSERYIMDELDVCLSNLDTEFKLSEAVFDTRSYDDVEGDYTYAKDQLEERNNILIDIGTNLNEMLEASSHRFMDLGVLIANIMLLPLELGYALGWSSGYLMSTNKQDYRYQGFYNTWSRDLCLAVSEWQNSLSQRWHEPESILELKRDETVVSFYGSMYQAYAKFNDEVESCVSNINAIHSGSKRNLAVDDLVHTFKSATGEISKELKLQMLKEGVCLKSILTESPQVELSHRIEDIKDLVVKFNRDEGDRYVNL